jgi:hypothetical protein
MPRYHDWLRRYVAGGLGGGELWADVSAHPAAAKLQAIPRPHLERFDDRGITFRITRLLLLDVIHAAGGVEYTVKKLLAALDVVQQWTDERSVPGQPSEYDVVPELWDVSFEVSNLVVWARTLNKRLQDDSRAREQGVKTKIGLLPALADGDLKDQVKRFRDQLANWTKAESWLAGYALHIGRLHGGGPVLHRGPDGRVRFLLPDPPKRKNWIWSSEEFTHRQNRDAETVAVDLLDRVERFMDGLLTSFEQHAR